MVLRGGKSIGHASRGFTLVEVMFAVITLGIGLILVAAMFPVAIQQTKLTTEESVGAELAKTAMATMEEVGQSQTTVGSTLVPSLKVTGSGAGASPAAKAAGIVQPLSFNSYAWQMVRGNLISPTDPRYAWIPMYRRTGDPGDATTWSSTAQIILIAVKSRNATQFTPGVVSSAGVVTTSGDVVSTVTPANIEPRAVTVDVKIPAGDTQYVVTFTAGATAAAAEGAYVVIADDKLTGADTGLMNGRIYKLAAPTDTTNLNWYLAPGNNFTVDNGANGVYNNGAGDDIAQLAGASAYIIGRGFTDPATATYTGPAMDVAAYSAFIAVK